MLKNKKIFKNLTQFIVVSICSHIIINHYSYIRDLTIGLTSRILPLTQQTEDVSFLSKSKINPYPAKLQSILSLLEQNPRAFKLDVLNNFKLILGKHIFFSKLNGDFPKCFPTKESCDFELLISLLKID